MKGKIAAITLLALTTGAHAQSSVTLYGRIDNGFVYRTGLPDGHLFGVQSGGWGESWWGLIGAEDLGGSTKVIFKLESGINTQNGGLQNGGLFGRRAVIGMTNETFGTLNLGNIGAGEIIQDSWNLDPQQMQQYAIATLVRGRNWAQAGNGIEYTSSKFGGVSVKGQYEVTNAPGNWNGTNGGPGTQPSNLGNPQGRSNGLSVTYTGGTVQLLAIYDEIRDKNGEFSDVYSASRSALVGGTLTWGPVRAYLGYQHLSAPSATLENQTNAVTGNLPGEITGAPTAVNHEWVGLAWQASPALAFTGAVYHANANKGNGNATLYTLGSTYNLSKRTFFYTELGYVTNSSTSNIGLGNGYADYYGPNTNEGGTSAAPNYGKNQFGAIAGIMHQF